MTVLTEYRSAVLEDVGSAAVSPSGQHVNIGSGNKSIWFNLVPRTQGEFVEAALITVQSTVNASTGTASSVASAVQLDAQIGQMFVAPAGATSPRSYAVTRLACQEVERLCFGIDDAGLSYPGTAVASVASGASVTYTNTILVPVGGPGGAVQIQTPPTTQAFGGTAPQILTTATCRVVSGLNPSVVTFRDDITTSFASGAAIDATTFLNDPALSADFIDFIGSTVGNLQGITVIGADGSFLVDINSGETQSLTNLQKYIGKANNSTASLAFNLRRQGVKKASLNLLTAGTLELLRIECANGPTTSPANPPAATAAAPASKQVGTPGPGGTVLAASGAGPSSPAYAVAPTVRRVI